MTVIDESADISRASDEPNPGRNCTGRHLADKKPDTGHAFE